jgi:hypothetical protein
MLLFFLSEVNNFSVRRDHAGGTFFVSFQTQISLLWVLVASVVLVIVIGFHQQMTVKVIGDSKVLIVSRGYHRLRTVIFLLLLDLSAGLKNDPLLRIPTELLLALER